MYHGIVKFFGLLFSLLHLLQGLPLVWWSLSSVAKPVPPTTFGGVCGGSELRGAVACVGKSATISARRTDPDASTGWAGPGRPAPNSASIAIGCGPWPKLLASHVIADVAG